MTKLTKSTKKEITMKKFEITYTLKKTFTVPNTATDEEYDEVKNTVVDEIKAAGGTDIKVKLVDAPDEIKQKYIINKDCQD
ncbi:MAG: hypothetical protein J6T10_11845 [Methanobrevibacter sp.]|nr:hypothetical protein [Methanobrevibacter sp.]